MPTRSSLRLRLQRGLVVAGLLLGMLMLAAIYVIGMSAWQSSRYTLYAFEELLIPHLIDVLVVAWLAWVGSSVGSFLNVVAWRMPRGEGVGGRSHCPRCETQLLARDNFPVFGWIALGGRCRTCRLPISPRYPIVEASVGFSLTAIGLAELYRFNLPHDIVGHVHGPIRSPTIDQVAIVTLCYHAVGVALSWACGLIRWDGNPIPNRLVAVGGLLVILPMLVMPSLGQVSWRLLTGDQVGPGAFSHLDAVARLLTALAAAGVAGRSLARGLCPQADLKMNPLGSDTRRLIDLIVVTSIPAILVGWQALPMVLLLASVFAVGLRRVSPLGDAMGRFAIAIPLATTIQLVVWRASLGWAWWPSEVSEPLTILIYAAAVLVIPGWLREPTVNANATPADVGPDDQERGVDERAPSELRDEFGEAEGSLEGPDDGTAPGFDTTRR